MINQKVVENIDRIRRCRHTFYGAMICAFVIFVIAFLLAIGLVLESGFGLAIYSGVMSIVFLWAIFIFYREDNILSGIIASINVTNSMVYIETVFGETASLTHCQSSVLDLAWLKRRRIWPSYFLQTSNNAIYPKYNWQRIKCTCVSSGGQAFYWISDGESSDLWRSLRGD